MKGHEKCILTRIFSQRSNFLKALLEREGDRERERERENYKLNENIQKRLRLASATIAQAPLRKHLRD